MNLIISFILVFNFGIVGVAIGTLISVITRGIELIIFSSKNVLNRSITIIVKKIFISIIQVLIITVISHFIFRLNDVSYLGWLLIAIKVFCVSVIIVIPFNVLFYKKDFKEFVDTVKGIIKWRRK